MRRKIKDLADITIGYQHRGASLSTKSGGTHRLIQIKDIDREGEHVDQFDVPAEHRLWLGDLYRVTPKGSFESYAVREGDLLFLSRGTSYFAIPIVRPYVEPFPQSWNDIIAASSFYILRLRRHGIMPEYLAWSLNGERAQAELQSMSRGTHMTLISKGDFASLCVDVPTLERQRCIIELYHLALKEQRVMNQIQQKRLAMVDAISRRAATGEN